MLTEDYCDFETAKLLKEKEFDEECKRRYNCRGELSRVDSMVYRNSHRDMQDKYVAPTLQMAMKWLREVHELYIEVSLSCDREDKNAKIFDASIFNLQNQRYKKLGNIQDYEEACEAAIKYCLENLI